MSIQESKRTIPIDSSKSWIPLVCSAINLYSIYSLKHSIAELLSIYKYYNIFRLEFYTCIRPYIYNYDGRLDTTIVYIIPILWSIYCQFRLFFSKSSQQNIMLPKIDAATQAKSRSSDYDEYFSAD